MEVELRKEKKKIKFRPPKFGSFGADGFVFALRKEPHVQRYAVMLLGYLVISFMLQFPFWLQVVGTMYFFLLIIFELFNTSIEILCDFVAEGHSIQIKRIKDLSAAAIFVHGVLNGLMLFSYIVYFLFFL